MEKEILSESEKKEIIQKLSDRNMKTVCPMCGQNKFIIADGYFNHPMQPNLQGFIIGGPSIPSIAIVCSNCGFMSQHALGVLGLLKGNKKAQE